VEAVWICSPSQYHASQIKACALSGKHVFCEKPIATDLPETIESINCCREAGVKLMIALQRRFDVNFGRVKQAIATGEVGEIVQVKLTSRDPSPPPFEYVKGGGGIFKDMAVHDLDMVSKKLVTHLDLWGTSALSLITVNLYCVSVCGAEPVPYWLRARGHPCRG